MNAKPFFHAVAVGNLSAEGKHYRLEADGEARIRLAETLGIPEVRSLTADLHLRPLRRGTLSLRGTLEALVVQTDVVTLEPVTQNVVEEIDLTLLAAEDAESVRGARPAPADAEEADAPEVYHNGRIDLGAIAAEHLALGLDPYPRAPGVAFPGHVEDDPASDRSAFAALAKLKTGKD